MIGELCDLLEKVGMSDGISPLRPERFPAKQPTLSRRFGRLGDWFPLENPVGCVSAFAAA
jgi:hypothetical protein